ncbi:unnamed protein product [Periconia digitata]|uniref:Secreted protein n=1 Tax=Periconia digitata TaxID=1303443 RepID=A0A9W4XXM2_9PLEO|nr:unnamed protein product [Periconia digitata]
MLLIGTSNCHILLSTTTAITTLRCVVVGHGWFAKAVPRLARLVVHFEGSRTYGAYAAQAFAAAAPLGDGVAFGVVESPVTHRATVDHFGGGFSTDGGCFIVRLVKRDGYG